LQKGIILQFIGNLDKNGYLCISYEEIAEECNCTLEEVQSAADLLHSLDPVGVGARDMKECLLIQLEHKGLSGGLTEKIIKLHLSKLENRKYDLIAKEEGVELKDVYTSVTTIQSLDPRPARQFTEDATRYIVPDIYISKVGKEYVITLNDDGMPRLVVSPYYLELLKKKDETSKEQRHYLNEKLKAASWLIKSIYQRQQTIYKVTESIVKYQREFLEYGIDRLKPLVLKEVANDIGMHESTVSRVTTNKYVHTPQGVFELKYFFTSGIKTAEGDISSSSIKEKIKSLIAAEDPAKPLSDQQIVETFQAENVTIARRTVAKYRESLGILSSSRRKKLF
jgi:RNA polymerase sigma-54 factor